MNTKANRMNKGLVQLNKGRWWETVREAVWEAVWETAEFLGLIGLKKIH